MRRLIGVTKEKENNFTHRIVEDNIYFLFNIYIYIYILRIHKAIYKYIIDICDTIVEIITHTRYYRQDMQLYAIFYVIL